MARISQASAQEVANKLVQKIEIEITAENKKLSEYLAELYTVTIPKDVMRMWERGKMWMRGTTSVYLEGVGLTQNYRTYSIKGELPKNSGSSTPTLTLKGSESEAVVDMLDRISDLSKKKKDTFNEVEALLLSMGTWKRAIEAIPEIASYAPSTEKVGIMVVPAATRSKIRCLINAEDKTCIEQL